jgi:hypothetical protein
LPDRLLSFFSEVRLFGVPLLVAVQTSLDALETAAAILLLLHAVDSFGDLLGLLASLLLVTALALQGFLNLFADFLPVESFALQALDFLLVQASSLQFLSDLLFLASLLLPVLFLAVLLLLLTPLLLLLLVLAKLFLAETALRTFVSSPAFLALQLADPLGNLLGLLTCLLAIMSLALQRLLNLLPDFLAFEAFSLKAADFRLAQSDALQLLPDLLFLAGLLLAGLLLAELLPKLLSLLLSLLLLHLAEALGDLLGLLSGLALQCLLHNSLHLLLLELLLFQSLNFLIAHSQKQKLLADLAGLLLAGLLVLAPLILLLSALHSRRSAPGVLLLPCACGLLVTIPLRPLLPP